MVFKQELPSHSSMILSALFQLIVLAKSDALCNDAKSVCHAFDFKKFDGKWIEVGGSAQVRERLGFDCTCTHYQFKALDNGNMKMSKVCNRGFFHNDIITENADLTRKEFTSQFRIKYPNKKMHNLFHLFGTRANYEIKNVWVKDGQYQYALVVAPKKALVPDMIENRFEAYWVLSRQPDMSEEDLNQVLRYLVEAGYHLDDAHFKKTEQIKCAAKAPLA